MGGGACRESGTDETRENLDTGPETGGGPEPPENPILTKGTKVNYLIWFKSYSH